MIVSLSADFFYFFIYETSPQSIYAYPLYLSMQITHTYHTCVSRDMTPTHAPRYRLSPFGWPVKGNSDSDGEIG